MRISETAKRVAARCEDAYSCDRYRSWPAVAEVLLQAGFNEAETEEVLRSKWTRWKADAQGNLYGYATSGAFTQETLRAIRQDFVDGYLSPRNWEPCHK